MVRALVAMTELIKCLRGETGEGNGTGTVTPWQATPDSLTIHQKEDHLLLDFS